MRYNIQYKIKSTYHGGLSCKKSNLFPVLSIRYQKTGSRRWTNIGNAEIDLYTYNRFKNTYYKCFEKRITTITTLEAKYDYERLSLFMKILDAEFSGSIAELVKSIVREKIVMEKADGEERNDVNRITASLLTGDWQKTNICV